MSFFSVAPWKATGDKIVGGRPANAPVEDTSKFFELMSKLKSASVLVPTITTREDLFFSSKLVVGEL